MQSLVFPYHFRSRRSGLLDGKPGSRGQVGSGDPQSVVGGGLREAVRQDQRTRRTKDPGLRDDPLKGLAPFYLTMRNVLLPLVGLVLA